jgi:cytochrome P450
MEPPVHFSSMCCFTENTRIQGVDFTPDMEFFIHIYQLQRNPKEWQRPHEYRPERFDPKDPMYLTPDGKKRHPMSFRPFFGGKRVCLGQTFVETVSKCIGPSLIYNFEMELVDEFKIENKPVNNMTVMKEPEIYVKLKAL